MPNMQNTKTPIPTRDALVRRRDFLEVTSGYTDEMALNEAARCLDCRNSPCVTGCPVGIAIPAFIRELGKGEPLSAYKIISEYSSLPAICGRVCPQESQCEAKCVRGIKGEPVAIGRLERYAADYHNAHREEGTAVLPDNGHRVAIVGSGPSGLSCAGALARKGYKVTVFEALHLPGGVLTYGIPEFRLPKAIVRDEVAGLEAMGVEIRTNVVIGRTYTVDELFEEGYEAIFIGSGAGLPRFMGIPGEHLKGVFSANEFLTRVNLMKAFDPETATPIARCGKVVVVGGGNVAMDAARTALRLGATEVSIVYRRSMEELPARKEEVVHAIEEGVDFKLLRNPVELLPRSDDKGTLGEIRVIEMALGEPDEKGRRRPVEVEGSEYTIEADTVIMAIGTSPNPLIKQTTEGLETDRRGCLLLKKGSMTSREGVFAGGDATTGAATVILAMSAGKEAAEEIDAYIGSSGNR